MTGTMGMPHTTGEIEPNGCSIGSLWNIASLLLYPLARYSLTLVAGRKRQRRARTRKPVSLELTTFRSTATCYICVGVSHERILILINNHIRTAGDHWTPQKHVTYTFPMPQLVFSSSGLTQFTSTTSPAAWATTSHHRAPPATAPSACCDRGTSSVCHQYYKTIGNWERTTSGLGSPSTTYPSEKSRSQNSIAGNK